MERALWRRVPRLAVTALGGLLLAGQLVVASPTPAHAAGFDPTAAEQQLFNLINQDRTQNGFAPLTANPTLFSIARGAPHQVCGNGQTFNGRAQDMIERGYFSHQIPPCNSYVWPILQSYGIQYSRAGENIAWNTTSPQSASTDQANSQFMNSAPHRANILGDYNQVGVGAWAAPGPWSDGSGTYDGVIMFVEIFDKAVAAAPAAPTGIAATAGNGSASLAWSAPSDGGSPITGYTVIPYVGGVASSPIGFGPGSTTVLVPGLTNGTAYSFTVSASNGIGSGPASSLSNAVTPMAMFPYAAVSTGQYQLTNSDGATWVEMDAANLRLHITPSGSGTALLSANADLWTAQAGVNQDFGIFVSAAGGPDTAVAWKESGGSAGTFSPNAAFVQGTDAMTAGTSYIATLQWKANIPAGGTLFAGAGPLSTGFSPTRLTAVLVSGGLGMAGSTQQYRLANSDGTSWLDIDPSALS